MDGNRRISRSFVVETIPETKFQTLKLKRFRSFSGVFPAFFRNEAGKTPETDRKKSGNIFRKKAESFKFQGQKMFTPSITISISNYLRVLPHSFRHKWRSNRQHTPSSLSFVIENHLLSACFNIDLCAKYDIHKTSFLMFCHSYCLWGEKGSLYSVYDIFLQHNSVFQCSSAVWNCLERRENRCWILCFWRK